MNTMTNIALDSKDTQKTADILHALLASEIALNLKIRNFHWNVEWIHFNDLHKFFEDLYNSWSEYADEVAERIRMLGHHTHASMKKYIELSFIDEEENIKMPSDEMISHLLKDNENIIRKIRECVEIIWETDDYGTEDFLIALLQKHEKDSWILRSLQG